MLHEGFIRLLLGMRGVGLRFEQQMKSYEVQFELPCENPVNNVRVIKRRKRWTFLLPINHPNAHNAGLQQLIEYSERAKLLDLSTPLKNTVDSLLEDQ